MAGTLTVNPVALTITADNHSKIYGGALPTLTASYFGLVNGDTGRELGHPAHPEHQGLRQQPRRHLHHHRQQRADANYIISYVSGTLSVVPGPPS